MEQTYEQLQAEVHQLRGRLGELERAKGGRGEAAPGHFTGRLQFLLDSIDEGACSIDLDGRFTFVNRPAEEMLGYSSGDLVGRDFHTLIHHCRPAGAPVPREGCAVQRAMAGGVSWHGDGERFWRRDGTALWVACSSSPLFEEGAIIGATITFRDISAPVQGQEPVSGLSEDVQRQIEEATADLRHVAAQSRAVLDSLASNIAVLDRAGRLIGVNGSWEAFAQENGGHAARTGVGVNYLAVCHRAAAGGEPAARRAQRGIRAVLEGRVREFTLEYPCHSPSERRWFLMRARPLSSGHGAVVSHINITARKHAEEGLRFLSEAGRRLARSLDYRATLAAVARMTVPFLADWCVVDVLDAGGAGRLASVAHADPEKERLARQMQRRYPPDPGQAAGYRRVIETGRPLLVEVLTEEMLDAAATDDQHRRMLRALHPRSYLLVPLRARGRTLGMLACAVTESNRRYGAVDLAVAQELARRAALALDNARLYQEAQAAVRLREEFLSMASHDLKTPLAVVKGFAEALERVSRQREGLRTLEVSEAARYINAAVTKMHGLIESLLDVSRLQQGRLALRPEPMDLAQLAAQVLARFAHAPERTPAHTLTLEAPAPVRGAWDPGRLDQVLSNLLSNALKYSPAGGAVRVAVRAAGGRAELAVADQGLGIPPAEQAALFRPFVRGATARRAVGGEGLGLYIAREIVRRHGGRIALASTPGRGTTVTVTLPLHPPDAAEE